MGDGTKRFFKSPAEETAPESWAAPTRPGEPWLPTQGIFGYSTEDCGENIVTGGEAHRLHPEYPHSWSSSAEYPAPKTQLQDQQQLRLSWFCLAEHSCEVLRAEGAHPHCSLLGVLRALLPLHPAPGPRDPRRECSKDTAGPHLSWVQGRSAISCQQSISAVEQFLHWACIIERIQRRTLP